MRLFTLTLLLLGLSNPSVYGQLSGLPSALSECPTNQGIALPELATSQESPNSQNFTGKYLLLANWSLLKGKAIKSGEYYRFRSENSKTESVFPQQEVLDVVNSPQQAYQILVNTVNFAWSGESLRLASWCIQEGLFDEADALLTKIARDWPDCAQLPALKKQITFERNKIIAEKEDAADPLEATTPSITAATRNATVAFQREQEQLRSWARTLPPGSVSIFSRRIQPYLGAHCGTAMCHGGNMKKSSFKLVPSKKLRPPEHVILRNLRTVSKFIDWQNPAASPILRAHLPDAAGKSVLPNKQRTLLANWATLLTYQVKPTPQPALLPQIVSPDVPQEQETEKPYYVAPIVTAGVRQAGYVQQQLPKAGNPMEQIQTTANGSQGTVQWRPGATLASPPPATTQQPASIADEFSPEWFNGK